MVLIAEALAKASNEKLEVLRAQYNEIDAKGVDALYNTVKKGSLPKLRRVELNGNKFSEDDAGVEGLRVLLEERREEAGIEEGTAEGEWGMDDLSDLEEESDEDEDEEEHEGEEKDEEEEDEQKVEREGKAERILRDTEEEEGKAIAQGEGYEYR